MANRAVDSMQVLASSPTTITCVMPFCFNRKSRLIFANHLAISPHDISSTFFDALESGYAECTRGNLSRGAPPSHTIRRHGIFNVRLAPTPALPQTWLVVPSEL